MRSQSAHRVRQTPDATEPLTHAERGMALITVIMVMMLVSALMIGFVSAIVADNRSSGLDRDQTQAYAATHAGLEKLTSDLSGLFGRDVTPSATQISDLVLDVNQPKVAGFKFLEPNGETGYKIDYPKNADGTPQWSLATITHGAYQGFRGQITPYDITVTSRSDGGAEVRMRRTLQTISVPVFQFGIFSETDLAFHAGDPFVFGGRVHTNGNLYLASATGAQLTIEDRITAVGDVIRTHLPNDLPVTTGYTGTIRIPTTIMADPTKNVYRFLADNEGSVVGKAGTAINPNWTKLSVATYTSNIRNGHPAPLVAPNGGTGAKKLDLPLVSQGAKPIDIIRRPLQKSAENVGVSRPIWDQRFFGMEKTSLRILLSDTAEEILNLPTVTQLPLPVDLSLAGKAYAGGLGVAATLPPLARSSLTPAVVSNTLPANVYKSTDAPLVNGFIKIEMQDKTSTNTVPVWRDVTAEILSLGIAGRNLATNTFATGLAARWNVPSNVCPEVNPNAVIRLQRVRDVPFNSDASGSSSPKKLGISCGWEAATGLSPNVSQLAYDYWPNALYDPREGQVRDNQGGNDIAMGGIMQYVELDMLNLKKWLSGTTGTSGTTAMSYDNAGFIVYFSDRRNNKTNVAAKCDAVKFPVPCETGEYGWEDMVNLTADDGQIFGVFDQGEDVNGNTIHDLYGNLPQNVPTALQFPVAPFDSTSRVMTKITVADKALVARANRTLHFRRALKIVNGARGNIITPGLTIASENPVYLQGDFNALITDAGATMWTGAHSATAIIADSVTTLSNNWNDIRSFVDPSDSSKRPAASTAYRVAIIAGKGIAFPKVNGTSSSFGSDGGVHNFMRNLEDWDVPNAEHRYRGSLVSFFISREATGTFKCCSGDTYVRGPRAWSFDTDFLTPGLLPPGTPMFRDINTLTFRQLLRPNQ